MPSSNPNAPESSILGAAMRSFAESVDPRRHTQELTERLNALNELLSGSRLTSARRRQYENELSHIQRALERLYRSSTNPPVIAPSPITDGTVQFVREYGATTTDHDPIPPSPSVENISDATLRSRRSVVLDMLNGRTYRGFSSTASLSSELAYIESEIQRRQNAIPFLSPTHLPNSSTPPFSTPILEANLRAYRTRLREIRASRPSRERQLLIDSIEGSIHSIESQLDARREAVPPTPAPLSPTASRWGSYIDELATAAPFLDRPSTHQPQLQKEHEPTITKQENLTRHTPILERSALTSSDSMQMIVDQALESEEDVYIVTTYKDMFITNSNKNLILKKLRNTVEQKRLRVEETFDSYSFLLVKDTDSNKTIQIQVTSLANVMELNPSRKRKSLILIYALDEVLEQAFERSVSTVTWEAK